MLYRQIQEQGLCTVGENNQLKVSGLNNVEMQLRKVRSLCSLCSLCSLRSLRSLRCARCARCARIARCAFSTF